MGRKMLATDKQIKGAIEASESLKEAASKLGVSTSYLSTRASLMRKDGVVIEKFKPGKKSAQVAA